MSCGVYLIWCASLERGYVGSSVNIEGRWRAHRSALKAGKHSNKRLQTAWTMENGLSFEFSVLELCQKLVLIPTETHWIRKLDTFCKGFNQTPTAIPLAEQSPEHRAKVRAALIKRNKTVPWTEERRRAFGARSSVMNKKQNHSEERRKASSERMKRQRADGTIVPRPQPEERRRKASVLMKTLHAKGIMHGGIQSDEHLRRSVARCRSGELNTAEQRQKASQTLKAVHNRRRQKWEDRL